MDSTKIKIREFLSRYLKGREIPDQEDIFAGGFVNSLVAVQMVAFIENEFEITLENDDLVLENFQTINAMSDLIERKRSAQRDGAAQPAMIHGTT